MTRGPVLLKFGFELVELIIIPVVAISHHRTFVW